MLDEEKLALEHAWRYFEAHGEQRMTVFNFFVATAGLLVAGLAYTIQASANMWPLGLAAGLLLILIAFVFWKLDQRVSSLIKTSEDVLAQAEDRLIADAQLRMVSREREMTANTRFSFLNSWTYGQAFRRIFLIMALIGVSGSLFSMARAVWPMHVGRESAASPDPVLSEQSKAPPQPTPCATASTKPRPASRPVPCPST